MILTTAQNCEPVELSMKISFQVWSVGISSFFWYENQVGSTGRVTLESFGREGTILIGPIAKFTQGQFSNRIVGDLDQNGNICAVCGTMRLLALPFVAEIQNQSGSSYQSHFGT